MLIKKLKERIKEKKVGITKKAEEFVELDESFFRTEQTVDVRIEELKDYSDVSRVQQFLREGNIIFLRIKDLKDKDLAELKRAVEKLKRTCLAIEGDIVGVDEDFIILTPHFARIFRGK